MTTGRAHPSVMSRIYHEANLGESESLTSLWSILSAPDESHLVFEYWDQGDQRHHTYSHIIDGVLRVSEERVKPAALRALQECIDEECVACAHVRRAC